VYYVSESELLERQHSEIQCLRPTATLASLDLTLTSRARTMIVY